MSLSLPVRGSAVRAAMMPGGVVGHTSTPADQQNHPAFQKETSPVPNDREHHAIAHLTI
jgi:hypothetical protein